MAGFERGSGFTGNGDFFVGAGFLDTFGDAGRDARLPLFAQGRSWDNAAPNAWLAMNMSDLSRPGPLDAATDDEALGILRKWRSLESWATSRKLAVARELIRRHPKHDSATDRSSSDKDACADWDPRLEREVSAALGISLVGAAKLLRLAWSLEARLPGVGKALREDRVDLQRTRTIVEETEVLLDLEKLAQAEEMILARLGTCKTYSDLLRLIQHAVITVDPDGAEKRRKLAEREHARVRFWRENSGTCGLAGTGLPTDEALAASAHIEARAQEYKAAGIKRYMDLLRVMAMLDLLSGVPVAERAARCRAEDGAAAADQDAQAEQAAKDARLRKTAQRARARRQESRTGTSDDTPQGNPDTPDDSSHDSPSHDSPDGGGDAEHLHWLRDDPPCPECGASECGRGIPVCDANGSAASGTSDDRAEDGHAEDDRSEDDRSEDGPEFGPGNWPDGGPGGPSPDNPGPSQPSSRAPGPGNASHVDPSPGNPGPGDPSPNQPSPGGPGPGNPSPGNTSPSNPTPSNPGPSNPTPGNPGPVHPSPGSPGSGLPIRGNLTLPLETLLGRAERAGEAHGLGALDPGLVRDLAKAGAGHPGSEFCITVTDEHGYAVGHGCCKPVKRGKAPRGKNANAPPAGQPGPYATFTPSDRAGPPGGFGSWILTLPGAPYPFDVDIEPVPTYTCDHRHESKGHDPSDKLRHLLQVRDGKCSFITCSRHARESDFEHATPYEKGGRTCGCNCHMCSRSCHRAKQSEGWSVTNPLPAFHQWTTGFGRTYVQGPWQYPS